MRRFAWADVGERMSWADVREYLGRLGWLGWSLVVLVIVVAGVIADRLGVRVAETRVERQIAAQFGSPPQVDIHGFPVLTQLAARRFGRVDVRIPAVTLSSGEGGTSLRIEGVTAMLDNLRLASGSSPTRVDQFVGSAVLPYEAVAAVSGIPGIAMEAADSGRVRLTGAVAVLGTPVEVAAKATLTSDAGQIVVQASEVSVQGGVVALDGGVSPALENGLTFAVPLQGLPTGMTLTGVQAVHVGVKLSFTGRNVLLDG